MPPSLHHLGQRAYSDCLEEMIAFTRKRTPQTQDQVWFLTHPDVLTLGVQGDPSHILDPRGFEIVRSDRGGQVTWHGPGQLVVYPLIDLHRRRLGIRAFVTLIEETVVDFLNQYGIFAQNRPDAPGVYINNKKIASVGLKVTRGRSYHGFSLNVNPDLKAFERIHPCGHPRLEVTSLDQCDIKTTTDEIIPGLARSFLNLLSRNPHG